MFTGIKRLLVPLILLVLHSGCNSKQEYYVADISNQEYLPNTVFESYEDLSSPKVAALKEKYLPDTILHGEEDEFRRILLLREWIGEIIHISDFETSYPGEGSPEGILDAAIDGHGFHCGHYMIVQNALLNAHGYITRCLGAGPGVPGGPDFHHGINEVWSNTYKKWFLSDAKYNHHFEKDGIPLSALEIRDEYLRNEARDIVLVTGHDRRPIPYDLVKNASGEMIQTTKKDFAQVYTWISWERTSDRFTGRPHNRDQLSYLIMYADDYFKDNTWIWDGNPHWAYGTEFIKEVEHRKAIEWTPNTISSKVSIENNQALVRLTSTTPNLLTYQLKTASAKEWENIGDSLTLQLTSSDNQMAFRTVNLAGVAGPEHTLIIAAKK
ncbi:MAG: hypothetical protein DHS20C17_21300 [Cyclobacteriaceae bacterium]|nr:MAG: hypothetical protein DHS20C17_21300 [Cyclobacteriaceae bacterium]